MSDNGWRELDDLNRDDLPNWTRDLAHTLDEWLFRMHGKSSSGHYVGAFLEFAEEHGLTVRPTIYRPAASTPEER